MYCVGLTNNTKLHNLSKDDIYSLDKSTILYCSKRYIPLNNYGSTFYEEEYQYMSLYVADLNLSYESYLKDYIENPHIYGFNSVEDNDIELSKYLNE